MDLRNFFAELKRRHVYRAAVVYTMTSWLFIQVTTQVFPFFTIPAWIVRLIITLLIAGFPIVDVKVTCFDGSYHDVDSKEVAYKIAGSLALKEAVRFGNPRLTDFEASCFDGKYITGDITSDYLRELALERDQSRGQAEADLAEDASAG